ncbi:MAG: hypothetical protein ACRD3G_11850 [Vicinamibacterales bacterium]
MRRRQRGTPKGAPYGHGAQRHVDAIVFLPVVEDGALVRQARGRRLRDAAIHATSV